MKILLVEDDRRLGKLIQDYLMPESELIDVINTGSEIRDKLAVNDYDVMILDVMLPKKNGIDICRELRAEKVDIAILFITALNNQNDKIKAFESGADDYLIKPFDFQELLLRVKALVRRENKSKIVSLQWGDLVMIPTEKKVYFLTEPLTLTPTEFKILQIFLQYPQQVFNTDNIIDKLWDLDNIPTSNTLRSHIKSLRRKFEEVGLGKDFIETVYGMGYKLKDQNNLSPIFGLSANSEDSSTHNKNISRQTGDKKVELEVLSEEIWSENRHSIYKECHNLWEYIQEENQEINTDEAIRIAHNLAGFLGSVGFDNGSKIAKKIELLLRENSDHLTDEKIINQISSLIDDLQTDLFPEGIPISEEIESEQDIELEEKVDILVIDEDQNLANNLILFIEHPQIVLNFAHSIESAIEYLNEKKFQVIIVETS